MKRSTYRLSFQLENQIHPHAFLSTNGRSTVSIAGLDAHFATPPTSRRYEKYEIHAYTATDSSPSPIGNDLEEGDSSPFLHDTKEEGQENASPPLKTRPTSRILSGSELSPLKILQDRAPDERSPPPPADRTQMPPPPLRSPRKMTLPEKRFPIKVSSPEATPRATPRAAKVTHERHISLDETIRERHISLDEAIRENEGLKQAIEIFEDEAMEEEDRDKMAGMEDSISFAGAERDEGNDDDDVLEGIDDTMASHFSTFSAVPNMAMFAKIGHSPSKLSHCLTPRGPHGEASPSPSPTPRAAAGPLPNRTAHYESGNTTNLLDFTEQIRFGHNHTQASLSPRRGQLSPSKTTPSATMMATPARQSIANLLDFDIPPLPTPRSIPTITPRELESLKSNFLSEISSLKASLSGKEAEVLALKTAVGDAETRVGECMEQLREDRGAREQLTEERDGWERRGREMEDVLRKVKEEIVLGPARARGARGQARRGRKAPRSCRDNGSGGRV